MASKGVVSAVTGVGAGLLMAGVYFGAPHAGLQVDVTTMTLGAAVAAVCASVALLTLAILTRPEKKKTPSTTRLCDLKPEDFARFPTSGVRLVLKADMKVSDLGIVRHPEDYTTKDILLTIKKTGGSHVFNPVLIRQLFEALRGFGNFVHIILVNEHDEYVGYIPAAYARAFMIGDNAETQISRYIIDVLANPNTSINLREINYVGPQKCVGLSLHESISDQALLTDAVKKVTANHMRGLVVFKGQRNRKPVGVIWDEDLVRLMLEKSV